MVKIIELLFGNLCFNRSFGVFCWCIRSKQLNNVFLFLIDFDIEEEELIEEFYDFVLLFDIFF